MDETTKLKMALIEAKSLLSDLFICGNFIPGGHIHQRVEQLVRLINKLVYG